ncbi:uncharacterized protein LOC108671485 [Hyalella azteca]|uniref:Uncharacterized protein LOC108671485 n=1 Tax=Hyalella azteca TaxID=294128 RepID=A0A979FY08_HYAAZ|nr:uncharacterized protein LOC108671485 [Hyalella azteca]
MESTTSSTPAASESLLAGVLTGAASSGRNTPATASTYGNALYPSTSIHGSLNLLNTQLVMNALQSANVSPSALSKFTSDVNALGALSAADLVNIQNTMKNFSITTSTGSLDNRASHPSDASSSKSSHSSFNAQETTKQPFMSSSSKSGQKNGRSPSRSTRQSPSLDASSSMWKNYEQNYSKIPSASALPASTASLSLTNDGGSKFSAAMSNPMPSYYKSSNIINFDAYNPYSRSNQTALSSYLYGFQDYFNIPNALGTANSDASADYMRSPDAQQHFIEKLALQQLEAAGAAELAKSYSKAHRSKPLVTSTPAKTNSSDTASAKKETLPQARSSSDSGTAFVDVGNKRTSFDNITAAIKSIFEKGDKMDNALVSLVSDDGVVVDAHQLLLVAASPFIKKVLSESEDIRNLDKPIIVLQGTKGTDVKALVQGFYTGRLPEDSNVTGVRAAAQMLGLHSLDEYFQSLLDDLTRNSSSRHKSDSVYSHHSSKQSPSSSGSATFPKKASESPLSVSDALSHTESFSPSSVPFHLSGTSGDATENRGSKRKSDASHSRAKVLKLDSASSESSPLNLSKSNMSEVEGSKSDALHTHSQQPSSSLPLNIDFSKVPSFPAANYDLNACIAAYNSLFAANQLQDLIPSANLTPAVLASLFAGTANAFGGHTTSSSPSTSKSKSSSSQSKNSKSSSSKSNKNSRSYDAKEFLKSLNDIKLIPTSEQENTLNVLAQLELQKQLQLNLDPATAAAVSWPLYEAAATSFSRNITDLSNCSKDSSGALNLSFDTREDSKPDKKDPSRMEAGSAATDSFKKTSSAWSGISANLASTPVFNRGVSTYYTNVPSTSTDDTTASALTALQNEDQANGILNSFLLNSNSSLSALQDKAYRPANSKTPDGQSLNPSSSVTPSVPGHSGSPVEDGIEDIIEVLSEDNGASLSAFSGDAAKLLYNAANSRRRSKRCNVCKGCITSEDCGACRYCLDKAKFGGPNKLKQVCKEKRCVYELKEKPRYRCGHCIPCRTTTDCGECNACLHNKTNGLAGPKKQTCEMQFCDYIQMEEFKATQSNCNAISQFSAEFARSEAHTTAAAAIAAASSNCDSPDSMLSASKKSHKNINKKNKQKLGKDGKPVPVKPGRMKYQCNRCYGCSTDLCCKSCIYCVDMPKYGGGGRFRQKCLRRLCISHPRLLSNKMPSGTDADCPSPDVLEALLEPYKLNMDAAGVAKTSVINFLRLHYKREESNLEKQIAKTLEVLDFLSKRLPDDAASCDMDLKEERAETPDQGDYLNDLYRRSGSASGSTPEPSDSLGAPCSSRSMNSFDKNRQLPELRPISGASSGIIDYASDASTSLAPSVVSSVFSTVPENYLATATAAGNGLSESELASVAAFQRQFQMQQLDLLALQQSQVASIPSEIEITEVGEAPGDESQGETDVDIEKIEADATDLATDLTAKTVTEPEVDVDVTVLQPDAEEEKSNPNVVHDDMSIVEDKAQPLDASPEVTVISNEEPKINEIPEEKIDPIMPSEDMVVDEPKSNNLPKSRCSSRALRTSDSRGRASRSSSDNSTSPPQRRSRLRELPARRGKRRRTTRYSSGYCDDSENDELFDDQGLASTVNSDGDEELLKVGSEDEEEEDDARTADIQAAVQDVLEHQLAEEEIKRTSKEKTDLTQNDVAETDTFCTTNDELKAARKSDLRANVTANHIKEAIITNDANGNTDISFGDRKFPKDDSSATYLNGPFNALNKVNVSGKADTEGKRTNLSKGCDPPPVPKLKLRFTNGPMSVEKIGTYDVNGVES